MRSKFANVSSGIPSLAARQRHSTHRACPAPCSSRGRQPLATIDSAVPQPSCSTLSESLLLLPWSDLPLHLFRQNVKIGPDSKRKSCHEFAGLPVQKGSV